jgi:Ser/Thr protein kinase RdoA (MazF antagonist)
MPNDAADLLSSYDLTPPIEVTPMPGAIGINNHVRAVRTGAGAFETYLSHRDPAVIRYDHDLLAWWRETPNTLRAFLDGPYHTLPRQVIHGDVTPGNSFANSGRIAAVFDFEFATPDVRAIDVASGLVFTMRIWERDVATALLMARRFRDGYSRMSGLTAAEVVALPSLMLLRDVVGAIWWLGRDLAAGDTRRSMERIAEVRERVQWIDRHAAAFRDAVR